MPFRRNVTGSDDTRYFFFSCSSNILSSTRALIAVALGRRLSETNWPQIFGRMPHQNLFELAEDARRNSMYLSAIPLVFLPSIDKLYPSNTFSALSRGIS